MTRIHLPTSFTALPPSSTLSSPTLSLRNPDGHTLSIHPLSSTLIRVTHELPPALYHQKTNQGIQWEEAIEDTSVVRGEKLVVLETSALRVEVFLEEGCPRLEWFDRRGGEGGEAFLRDSRTRAYAFDKGTGGVMHYVERENHLPVSEDEHSVEGPRPFLHEDRNEFVYGLGESRGTLEKTGKRFTMEGRDALSYDWENGDPLYKVCPFYTVYNKATKAWYGIFYNNLSDSSFDMGAESDILWGCFRSYRANCGPLDYYVITGDGTLASTLTAYASLVSPTPPPSSLSSCAASPTLPPLSQFGYLSSSLSLAADQKAQEAILSFLRTSRAKGFPVDGLYLSSGWCQDELTDDRHYFSWNLSRYPSPATFGHEIETTLDIRVIVNMKPWLLETHPLLASAESAGAFVRAAPDAQRGGGTASGSGDARSWVWSSGFGKHARGRYFDYSSRGGSEWWKEAIREQVLEMGLTGMWIDNNEMAGMVDDEELFRGELGMWNAEGVADNVERRMGSGRGETRVGSVGKAIQTIGMARATYEAVLAARPTDRPVIVSRSGAPGIQAYAHATWSGDNSTTWKALKWGTKMTLSVGMSFGPGLYGHDIGGFAGKHHPSAELLVRWCQNGAWHSRFTVHSWKEVSTTLWMYDSEPGISDVLRDVLAFRYRLAPTFYSLYVSHYQRRGWPILKPLLWHHSDDPATLRLDEEFLFGSHVLVAPVTEKGATFRSIYLPSIANDGETQLQWCELDTGIWHAARADFITLDAPLSRTPVLVRAGGIIVLGGSCSKNIYDGVAQREVLLFPSPPSSSPSRAGTTGFFTLVEDDGRTNGHTLDGAFTELELSFRIVCTAEVETIVVDYAVVHARYELLYEVVWFELPEGDARRMVAAEGRTAVVGEGGRFGLVMEL